MLLQSVKYKILAMKEFEHSHILAHWIRQLFVDALREQPTTHPSMADPESFIQQRSVGSTPGSCTQVQVGDYAGVHSEPPSTTLYALPTDSARVQFSSENYPSTIFRSITNEDRRGLYDISMGNQGSENPEAGPNASYDLYAFEQLQCNLFDL